MMRLSELIALAQDSLEVDGDLLVQVAYSAALDEWYEVTEVTHETDHQGGKVFVINTD